MSVKKAATVCHYSIDEYEDLSSAQINKVDHKFIIINVRLVDYNYDGWFTEEESDDKTLEGDKYETKN